MINIKSPCVNVAIFYPPDLSYMWFPRNYDMEYVSGKMYDRTLRIKSFIESIVINMSACSFVRDPSWEMSILYNNLLTAILQERFSFERFTLPARFLNLPYFTPYVTAFWRVFNMQKPEDAPAHNIWSVWLYNNDIGLRASIEVLLDHSSSCYSWDNTSSSNKLYITVNKAFNIMLESNSVATYEYCGHCLYEILFTRDLHDEIITKYVTGQTPQQFHFSFHNQR